MNNQVSKLLDVKFPQPNHSNFNLGRKRVTTTDVGYLVPVYTEEILANSYKRLDVEALVQCNATVAPVMGSFTTKLEAYFIPIRIYHQHLMNNDRSADYDDDFEFHRFPWVSNNSSYRIHSGSSVSASDFPLYCSAGSLLEHLGMFPAGWNSCSWTHTGSPGDIPSINPYCFIGYFDIFRNYYSNPYDTRVPFRVSPNSFFNVDYSTIQPDGFCNLEKFDDFINSVRAQSVTSAGSPQPVDVFALFNKEFTFNYAGVVTSTIPLFANQKTHLVASGVDDLDTSNGLHYGLLRRTYKDDYFNARLSTSFVQYLKEQSRVIVDQSTNTFDITQLRLANRIAKYVDKLGFSDSRFGSWLKAHFGTRLNDRMDIPQFLGSISSTLAFQDIISNAQTGDSDVITSNQALGSRAGLGSGYLKNKGAFVEFKSVEPGYLIVLMSIVPNVSYTQGIRKMFLKNRFSDLYTPEFDAVGYQDLHTVEFSAIGFNWKPGNITISGPLQLSDYNKVVGKQPAWLEYMTSVDESHGLAAEYTQYGYWALNRPYDQNAYYRDNTSSNMSAEPVLDLSTYIFPEYFNSIFAVNKNTDNFQVQLRFYDRTSQPMSKQVLPRL